jgi:AcrR family transcriptional regulator
MAETKGFNFPGAGERILANALTLFSRHGYKGVSTREIAAAAKVNEITVFRHYPHKRDLYLAVMTSALGQVHIRGELLSGIAESGDAETALARTFELISKTMMEKPEILRLLQYSALELGDDFNPLIRRHLSELIEVTARYLEPWIEAGKLRCSNGRSIVFTFIAIVASHSSINRVFSVEELSPDGILKTCANLYVT